MTLDELFSHIVYCTKGDKHRAVQAFLAIDEYMTDAFGEIYWDKDGPFEDFGDYASKQLDILEGKNK
jgi:hypothetical protein